MPGDTFERALDRMLDGRMGTTVTLTNYTDDGTRDKHGDPEKVQDNQTTGVSAHMVRPDAVDSFENDIAAGAESSVDVFVFVKDENDVREPGMPDGQGGEHRYGTEITSEATDRVYTALSVWDEGGGQYRIAAREAE